MREVTLGGAMTVAAAAGLGAGQISESATSTADSVDGVDEVSGGGESSGKESKSLWRRYSLLRFTVVGTANTVLFFLLYLLLQWLIGDVSHGKTLAWGLAWTFECIISHFMHRRWTFHSDSVVLHSLSMTTIIYTVTMFTSSLTFDLLVYRFAVDHYLAWWLNVSAWGLVDYWVISRYAFPEWTREQEWRRSDAE